MDAPTVGTSDNRAPNLTAECPRCNAQPGERCREVDGNAVHGERLLGRARTEHYARVFGPDAAPVQPVDLSEIGPPLISEPCSECGASAGEPCRGLDDLSSHGARTLTPAFCEDLEFQQRCIPEDDPFLRGPSLAPSDPVLRYVSDSSGRLPVRFDSEANVLVLDAALVLHYAYHAGMSAREALDQACRCLIAAARLPAPTTKADGKLLNWQLWMQVQVGVSGVAEDEVERAA